MENVDTLSLQGAGVSSTILGIRIVSKYDTKVHVLYLSMILWYTYCI